MEERQLERLERAWAEEPVFFISTRLESGEGVLNTLSAVELLVEEWRLAQKRHGWSVGPYLVLPDGVQFFCAADISARPLSQWLQIWKEWTSKRMARQLGIQPPAWESGYSKNLLQSEESFSQKWQSVCQEPVRAHLVDDPEDWPWRGDLEKL
jgi:hypothetical protein